MKAYRSVGRQKKARADIKESKRMLFPSWQARVDTTKKGLIANKEAVFKYLLKKQAEQLVHLESEKKPSSHAAGDCEECAAFSNKD